MKYLYSLLLLILCAQITIAQLGQTISVQSKYILGPCGDTLTLRGINYAAYNWGWSPSQLNIDKIALTGANCIRIPWYKTPSGVTPISTYGNLVNLDSVLSKCIQYKLIPILDLHDETCQNNPSNVITLSNWYTQAGVLTLIAKYKHSLILNLANEALFVGWAGNAATAQTLFINTYSTICTNLRNAGITVPLMIDAPDCGTNLDMLASMGSTLQAADPQHNLIFSAHAYWYAYANNDSTQMLSKINNALTYNIPFLLGEISNQQDDASPCQYNLNYKALLNICKQKKVGWLAWSWDNDICSARQISTNGTFSSLTIFGNDIIYNSNYGLLVDVPAKSQFLISNGCNLKVKAFIQGYSQGTQTMRSVLNLSGLTSNTAISDSIKIELRSALSPFTLVASIKSVLQTNGTINAVYPASLVNSSYYIVVKQRNTITTWSALPVLLKYNTSYDFTTSSSKAYLNNETQVSGNIWAMYSGDINQDEVIDGSDNMFLENGIDASLYGYNAADLNGDGSVDGSDYVFWDLNSTSSIYSKHP